MADQRSGRAVRAERVAQDIAPRLLQYLRRHYRLLAADHDDVVQETVADLLDYLARRADQPPPDAELPALGYAILKRRMADRFREATRHAVTAVPEPWPADSPDPEASLRYRRLLKAVLALVAELGDDDQQLLLREQLFPEGAKKALSDAERKRLSRLRARLRAQLETRFGVAPEDYLKG